jgi:hypothetical protein
MNNPRSLETSVTIGFISDGESGILSEEQVEELEVIMKNSKPFSTTGCITEDHQVVLDAPVPLPAPHRVRVFIFPEEEDIPEDEWMRFLSTNPAFAEVVNDEGVYTLEDGEPFVAEG